MVSRLCGWTGMGASVLSLVMSLAGTIPAFSEEQTCPETDTGLSLPRGFCATIFADKIGHARQLAVASDGTVYVNTWSGIYYGNDKPHDGGFLVALKDTKGTGHADVNVRFGPTFAEGAHGGTGIWLYKNWLYAELNDKIVRYALKDGEVAPTGKPETILSGMPITGDHPDASVSPSTQTAICSSTMGSATNACEKQNRMPHSPGNDPCTELETRGGIWRYDANKTDQVFSPKERYATGLRNGEGFDFDTAGRLFVTQHGRDQLHEDWPELYTAQQGFELPAEEVVILEAGRQLRLAVLLLRRPAEEARAGAGIRRRRRQEGWRMRQVRAAGRGLSCSLGAQRSQNLQRVRSSRRRTREAPSLPSMARGTVHRDRRADTTSFSSRCQTARPPAITSSSPTASPVRRKSLGVPCIVHRVSPWAPMARFTSLTTRRAGSGA